MSGGLRCCTVRQCGCGRLRQSFFARAPSYVCVEITGTPGADVVVNASGPPEAFDNPAPPPARIATASQTVTLPVGGKLMAKFKIWNLGQYDMMLTASNAGGVSATKAASIVVVGGAAGTVVGPPGCGPA